MGNSMLQNLIAGGPVMKTVSLPRGRHRLHTMPTSTGYEVRNDTSYDWDGRKRGQTPFTVVQHTLSGAGNLRYENRIYRVRPDDTLLLLVPKLTGTSRAMSAPSGFDPGSVSRQEDGAAGWTVHRAGRTGEQGTEDVR